MLPLRIITFELDNGHVAPLARFKFGGLRHLGAVQEVQHCWSADAGNSAGVACTATALNSLIAASVNGDVVCSASWIRMADTLNTCFTNCSYWKNHCCYRCVRIFLECITIRIAKYQPASDVLIHIRPVACYAFIKITLVLHHLLLYVVYMCQKSLNFMDAFHCYRQIWKLVSLDLANPVSSSCYGKQVVTTAYRVDVRQMTNCHLVLFKIMLLVMPAYTFDAKLREFIYGFCCDTYYTVFAHV